MSRAEVLKRSGLKIGEPITEQSLKALNLAAAAVDEHLKVVMHHEGEGRVSWYWSAGSRAYSMINVQCSMFNDADPLNTLDPLNIDH